MLRFQLACLFFFTLFSTFSQIKLPAPISDKEGAFAVAMMPDSSMIVAKSNESNYEIVRYIYRNANWETEANDLSKMLNGIVYQGSHLHYRFSNDYTRLIVMLHGKGDQRIYLSELEDGQWSLFRDIIDPTNYSYFNFTPSFSHDNSKLYLSDNSKPENTLYTYTNTESFYGIETRVLDEFLLIQDVIGVGNNSILINGQRQKKTANGWFLVKKLGTNQWSVPYRVKELDGGEFKSALSFTPFEEYMMYTHFISGDVFLIETSQILRDELNETNQSTQELVNLGSNQAERNTDSKDKTVKPTGEYYALLIGNSDYKTDELDLDQPHKDVLNLQKVLEDHYSFDSDKIWLLENADRESIFSTMFQLRSLLNKDDNLLIFYAGHGYWDEDVGQGYWWPVDARPNNPSNWLSNSDLREQIRAINTAHTLLISDACFSGGIFKTRGAEEIRKASTEIQLLYRMPSRRAITSGTMSTEPDKSVFFEYLIKYLEENPNKFTSSSELFNKVRKSVLNNSLTVPQNGVIMNTGDEGGDFIFIRRD